MDLKHLKSRTRLFSFATILLSVGAFACMIGIFNSPGWSQSGGPWVKNEQSMRYLNSLENSLRWPK